MSINNNYFNINNNEKTENTQKVKKHTNHTNSAYISSNVTKILKKENQLAKIENKPYEQIYEDVFNLINEIVLLIKPSNFLMISADCIEPLAKLKEQIRGKFVRKTINE